MILRSLLLLASVIAQTLADVQVVTPAAGAVIAGLTLDVQWEESGDDPPITDFVNYSLFLCAGGNSAADYIPIATLVSGGSYKKGDTISITLQAATGANVENAYFLKFLSAATGGSVINFSDRFSLTSMTGVFTPVIQTGLQTVVGTAGPPTENDVNTPGAVPAVPPAAGISPAAGAALSASIALPYTMQTGPIRYGPMPLIGQQSITAKAPSMRYPTSSYNIAKTYLGPADAQSTLIPQATQFHKIENTVSDDLKCVDRPLADHI